MTVEKIKAHAEEKSYYRCAHKPAWKLEFFHRKLQNRQKRKQKQDLKFVGRWMIVGESTCEITWLFFAWLFNLWPDQISTIPIVRLGPARLEQRMSSVWHLVITQHITVASKASDVCRREWQKITKKKSEVLNIHSHAWDNIENISRVYGGIFLSQCDSKPNECISKSDADEWATQWRRVEVSEAANNVIFIYIVCFCVFK